METKKIVWRNKRNMTNNSHKLRNEAWKCATLKFSTTSQVQAHLCLRGFCDDALMETFLCLFTWTKNENRNTLMSKKQSQEVKGRLHQRTTIHETRACWAQSEISSLREHLNRHTFPSHWSTSAAFTASVVFKGYKWGYAYRLQRLQMGVRIPAPKGTRRSSMTSSQKLHQAFRRCRENLHFQVVQNSVKSKKRCFAFSELNICKYKNYCLRMNFTWSVVDGTDEDKTSTKRKRHMTLNQSGVTSYVTTYVSVPVGVSRGRRFR